MYFENEYVVKVYGYKFIAIELQIHISYYNYTKDCYSY